MSLTITNELISTIKKNSFEKPDFIVEDVGTIDFKERSGSLIIDRSYQRNFIQTEKSMSKYVESIFLGLIIPEIQVYENYENGYREIIDGQQRVLSLLKFLRGEYKLKGLSYLTVLNGMRFDDLPIELQTIFKQFGLNMRVAKNSTVDYKYSLFERLNVGSKPLNAQEVRNCVFKDNEILKMTRQISDNDVIKLLFEDICAIKNERFLRDELIINILSVVYGDLSLSAEKMKDRINKYLTDTNSLSQLDAEALFTEFFDVTDLIISCLDTSIFDMCSYKKNILESVYVALFKFEDKELIKSNKAGVEKAISKAVLSGRYLESASSGQSRANKDVLLRANIVLKEILKAVQ